MNEPLSSESPPSPQPRLKQDPAKGPPAQKEDRQRRKESRQIVQTGFCAALINGDRPELRRVIDDYLKSLATADPVQSRVEKLRQWIAAQPCVASAERVPVLLDTEPPVQQILVVLSGDGHSPPHRSIDIVLDPAGPRFNYR